MLWLLFVLFPLISGIGICPPGSQYDSDDQYCYTLSNESLSWTDATTFCSSLNGNLIAPRNAFDEYSTVQITRDFGITGTWLGIYGDYNNNWEDYTTGNPITYYHWATGEPSLHPGCAYMTGSGDWVSIKCQTKSNVVCESRPSNYTIPVITTRRTIPVYNTTTTAFPVSATIDPTYCQGYYYNTGIPCPNGYRFYLRTCSCYMFEAEDRCGQYQGHLASIHSVDEAVFIMAMSSDSSKMIQVGLHYVGDKWEWSDRTPVDYLDWAPRGNDGDLGRSSCTFIYPWGSYFNTYLGNGPCLTKYSHSVCKIPLL